MDKLMKDFPVHYLLHPQSKAQRIKYHAGFWLVFILFHLLYFANSKQKIHYQNTWLIAYTLYYLRFIPVYYISADIFNRLRDRFYGNSLMVSAGLFMVLAMHAANVGVFYILERLFKLDTLSDAFAKVGNLFLRAPDLNTAGDWLMLMIYDVTEMQLLFLPLGVKMIQYGFKQQIQKQDLLAEKLKNDLVTLRAQAAPHFILNSLNSVVSELLPVKKKAATYLRALTDVIHFTLYASAQEQIVLEREWQALVYFTNLQARRFEDRLKITVRQNGPMPKGKLVPTLILFTLTENAFKHGVYPTMEDCWILIELTLNTKRLQIKIANSKPKILIADKSRSEPGIGLDNIKKRLQLSAPDDFRLTVHENEDQYLVELDMPLTAAPV